MTDTPKRRFEDHFPAEPLDWSDAQAEQSSTAGAARQGGDTNDDLSFEEALLKRITDAYVAKFGIAPGCVGNEVVEDVVKLIEGAVPPLTAPAPLTDEEIDIVWQSMPGGPGHWLKLFGYQNFARAIEAEVLAKAAPAAPVQTDWYKPLPTPEQLLAVARDTGLRSYLHGVNATEAREILSTYIDAVRLLDTGYLAAPVQADQAQAAEVRAQALEDAAKLCESLVEKHGLHSNFICAMGIRSLAQSSTADKACEVRAAEEWPTAADILAEDLENIAGQWEGCIFQAPAHDIDIGASLRAEFAKIDLNAICKLAAPSTADSGNTGALGEGAEA